MNNRHRKTLDAIFAEQTPANIVWKDIEALLRALGADIAEGNGSRVRIALNGVRAVFHRPHPQPEVKRYAVRDMKQFLINAGVTP